MTDKDIITVTGTLGTDPTLSVGASGTPCSNFRLASTARILDQTSGTWRDGDTNWYTVVAFRRLAGNIQASLHTGDRVVVTGKLRVQNWTGQDGKSRTTVEILADSVGPDLTFAVATVSRNPRPDATTQPGSTVGIAEGEMPEAEAETEAAAAGEGVGVGEAAFDADDQAAVLAPF